MSGIYFHIPFCSQACHYCDFHFSTSTKYYDQMVEGLLDELTARAPELNGSTVKTIYFGGGTPSILTSRDIERFLNRAGQLLPVAGDVEITLEANPDDLSVEKLNAFKQIGINRLSIGIQTFDNQALKVLNRSHTGQQAEQAVKNAQDIGFENITCDLIYGLPGSTPERCEADLTKMIELHVPHISAYNLTIEPGTALHHQVKSKAITVPHDDEVARQFELGMALLNQAGFEHYEISNYARPGFRSQHNSNYWNGAPYLGIGPSAHSYGNNQRRWNISNNGLYMKVLKETSTNWFTVETLSLTDRYNEYVLTRLRTSWGCNLVEMNTRYGQELVNYFRSGIKPWITSGHLVNHENTITLTTSGKLLADRIASDLFYLDESGD